MKPQITPKLEADAHEIRWICTTGCPKETYGNQFKQKKFRTRSATEKFKCEVLSSALILEEKLHSRLIELQKEYNDELKGNKIILEQFILLKIIILNAKLPFHSCIEQQK